MLGTISISLNQDRRDESLTDYQALVSLPTEFSYPSPALLVLVNGARLVTSERAVLSRGSIGFPLLPEAPATGGVAGIGSKP